MLSLLAFTSLCRQLLFVPFPSDATQMKTANSNIMPTPMAIGFQGVLFLGTFTNAGSKGSLRVITKGIL